MQKVEIFFTMFEKALKERDCHTHERPRICPQCSKKGCPFIGLHKIFGGIEKLHEKKTDSN